MIIAIDGYEANVKNRVGIGRYAYEVIKQMFEQVKSQKLKVKSEERINFRIYVPRQPLPDMPVETEWWTYRLINPAKLWTFIALPLALWIDYPRANVVFSPTHYIPRFTSIPKIMSIMDLSYLEYPELFKPKDLYQLRHWTAHSVHRARKILTISEFSKNAIMKAYHIPEERVVVTYPGITKMANDKFQMTNVLDRYSIKPPYILSVGTLQPRKNYARLIEAFSTLKNDKAFKDVVLVLVGKKGWLYEDILSAPRRFGVEARVRFLDFVSDEDLPELYRNARCFALPSLYEGFGLPVLEAMAERCPVVVSRVSSLPEIAGDAGIYVDPQDLSDIAEGLRKAMTEDQNARKRRTDKGFAQAQKFSWEKAAQETLKVIAEVGKENT